MRTRTRNTAIRVITDTSRTVTGTQDVCNGAVRTDTVSRSGYTKVAESVEERITDSLGRGTSHPVIHRRLHRDHNTSLPSVKYGWQAADNYVYSYDMPNNWQPGLMDYVDTVSGFDVNSSGLPARWSVSNAPNESLARSLLLERARQLKADVLLNIVEANQIWPAITTLTKSLPAMARDWGAIRRMLKTASGAFLAYKFGISPLLSDMMAILRYLPKISADLKKHADGDRMRFSSVYPVGLTYDSSPYLVGSYTNGYAAYKYWGQGRQMKSSAVRYVLVVKPVNTYHTAFFQKASLVMDRFATSPASLAWELVPFSFVVDWFVDLRSALNKLDSLLGISPYQVVSFTRSFSYELAADHFFTRFSPCSSGSVLFSERSASFEYKHYDRSLVSGGQLVTWNPRFGKNQAAISAALITQALLKIPGAMRNSGIDKIPLL